MGPDVDPHPVETLVAQLPLHLVAIGAQRMCEQDCHFPVDLHIEVGEVNLLEGFAVAPESCAELVELTTSAKPGGCSEEGESSDQEAQYPSQNFESQVNGTTWRQPVENWTGAYGLMGPRQALSEPVNV